jgi:hypothetical protein
MTCAARWLDDLLRVTVTASFQWLNPKHGDCLLSMVEPKARIHHLGPSHILALAKSDSLVPLLCGNGQPRESPTGKGSRTRPVPLLEPVLVPVTADEKRRAIEALAELLAPLFLDEPAREAEAER